MRFIFGRFIDCFILWALSVFYPGKPNANFWIALSHNIKHGDYAMRLNTALFETDFLCEVWGLYINKAWQEFVNDVLNEELNEPPNP